MFTFGAVLLSSVGSLTASRNRRHGLPFWPALGFGMLYGAAVTVVVALLQGQSVLTFACFLTLQERIGPGPTGAIGVMTPLLAVTVSVIFEAFRPDLLTVVGAAMAVGGNVLMLRRAGG